MRIRGRQLPYPILVTDPSSCNNRQLLVLPPNANCGRGEEGKEDSLGKEEEKGLHPNGDLRRLDRQGLMGNSSAKRDSQINNSIHVVQKEEEKGSVQETTSNGGAQANRITSTTTTCAKEEEGKDSKKPKRSSTALMEGSRCSRMNGRGWRCSQPTLVGYSLCEHHLGKGRQKGMAGTAGTARAGQLGCTDQERKKKARSISSLLDQNMRTEK